MEKLFLAKDFGLKTDGSKYTDHSGVLKDAFSRLHGVVTTGRVVDADFSTLDHSLVLHGIHLLVFTNTDEAYTIYGALHGLQTFSQLCQFNTQTRIVEVAMVPWTILDAPRFPFRGLLVDTSRHYQPLAMMKKVIDSMVYAKLNVLHWHIVDKQSFPLEVSTYPKLWDGAYSNSERYTRADAAEIVSYAQRRGVNVLAEIDVPGHALSW